MPANPVWLAVVWFIFGAGIAGVPMLVTYLIARRYYK